jgi:ABC-2 type transport system permease protein
VMGAWDITRKDLGLLVRDRRSLPLLFIAILGMSTGQFLTGDSSDRRYSVAIVDESHSETSQRTVRQLEQHADLQVVTFHDDDAARIAMNKNEVSAVLTIGPQYADRVEELRVNDLFSADEALMSDGPDGIGLRLQVRPTVAEAGLIRYFLFSEVFRSITPVVARKNTFLRRYLPEEELNDGASDVSADGTGDTSIGGDVGATTGVDANNGGEVPSNGGEVPSNGDAATGAAETESAAETNRESSPDSAATASRVATSAEPSTSPAGSAKRAGESAVYRFLVPGFTVMFVFFLINVMARSFIAERELGTMKRLQLAPIPAVAVLVGKTLPFYVCSIVQTGLLFLSGKLLFGMSWGTEPVYLIPVVLSTSAAATGLGLWLATSVKTDQQVSAYGTSMVLILGGISGCFIPRAWLPDLMKTISLATPHAWALQAFDAVLTPSVVDTVRVLDLCAVLLGFASLFFALGWWRFRNSVA